MKAFIVAIATAFGFPAVAFPDAPSDSRPREEQTLFFRAVLKELGAQAITNFDDLTQSPEKKVLIALGPTHLLDGLATGRRLSRFLAAGGAVLVATDQSMSAHLASQIGAQVDGRYFTGQHADIYRGSLMECPLLHEVRRKERPSEPHPIFRDLSPRAPIATNRPSLLFDWNRGENYRQIAVIDAPLAAGIPGPTVQGYRTLGVVAEFPTGGRLLVLADHSIFIDMMVQPDNFNLDFTVGVLRWLTDDGKRSEVLMIDNNAIQTSFNVSLVRPPMGPMPSIQDLLPIISHGISDLQREDRINKLIQQAVPHSALMRNMALILTLVLLAAGTYCFLHARHRFDPRPKLSPSSAEPALPGVTNYSELARELAMDLFREPAPLDSAVPEVAVHPGAQNRDEWKPLISRLWSVARGDTAIDSAGSLKRVHADCQELRAALSSGVVRFAARS